MDRGACVTSKLDKNGSNAPLVIMPISKDPPALSVALLAVPEVSAAVLYGLHEVFSSVGTMWQQLTGDDTSSRRMAPWTVGASPGPLPTTMGASIVVDHALSAPRQADVVIVSDLILCPGQGPRGGWPQECDWLRRQHEAGAIVCSVCTGSLLLAEAGLLHQREATSHWSAGPIFKKTYPDVDLKLQRVLVGCGETHDIVTSGGSASWTDFALYLIARFCGVEEARRIAKIYLFGDRGEGQLPFAARVRPLQHDDAIIADCQAFIADHYSAPNPVAAMVQRSGLSPRTFVRRFHTATGHTPIDYAQSLRVEEAKQMLETSHTPIDDIAHSVGYDDANSFRRLFRRMVGTSPHKYRQRYRAIAPSLRDTAR